MSFKVLNVLMYFIRNKIFNNKQDAFIAVSNILFFLYFVVFSIFNRIYLFHITFFRSFQITIYFLSLSKTMNELF